ncbi:hypothetical protein TUM20983_38130 [Mycobacterium antarcticum]|uniref:HAD family hydrolase n=1 Tax=Mycolicibacterium sp. TUM20983 TaxID=3023369 RepID=UPI0023A761C7|nr:hypothetical protein [Mycolicibacterium sp. TUM20983]GLP76703.1 hypothetical protein TUM20983_38130 [Mycolicibacterium sp. TUM20983]
MDPTSWAVVGSGARGERAWVSHSVTAKAPDDARRHLPHLGFDIDEVHGLVWREGKADVLGRAGADVYVGDHTEDMVAPRRASALGVGVTTGPCNRREFLAAGAHCLLSSLSEFRGLLARQTR